MIPPELTPRYIVAYEAGDRWIGLGEFEKDLSTAMSIAGRLSKNGFRTVIYKCDPEPIKEFPGEEGKS